MGDLSVGLTRKDFVALLAKHVYSVTFTKKDGTERTMVCTLDHIRIPEENRPGAYAVEGKPSRKKNQDTVPVWSIEDEGWRSFRLDSVKNYHMISDEDFAAMVADPNTKVNKMRKSLGLPLVKE